MPHDEDDGGGISDAESFNESISNIGDSGGNDSGSDDGGEISDSESFNESVSNISDSGDGSDTSSSSSSSTSDSESSDSGIVINTPDFVTDDSGGGGGGGSSGGSSSGGGSSSSSNNEVISKQISNEPVKNNEKPERRIDTGSTRTGDFKVTELDSQGRPIETNTFDNRREFENSKFGNLNQGKPDRRPTLINPNANPVEKLRQEQLQQAQRTERQAQNINEQLNTKENILENREQTQKVQENLEEVRTARNQNKGAIAQSRKVEKQLQDLENVEVQTLNQLSEARKKRIDKAEEIASSESFGNPLFSTGSKILDFSRDVDRFNRENPEAVGTLFQFTGIGENLENRFTGASQFRDTLETVAVQKETPEIGVEEVFNFGGGRPIADTEKEEREQFNVAQSLTTQKVEDVSGMFSVPGTVLGIGQSNLNENNNLIEAGRETVTDTATAAGIGAIEAGVSLAGDDDELKQEAGAEIFDAANPISVPGLVTVTAAKTSNTGSNIAGKTKDLAAEAKALRSGAKTSKSGTQQMIEVLAQQQVDQSTLQTAEVDTATPGASPDFVNTPGPQSQVETFDTTGTNLDLDIQSTSNNTTGNVSQTREVSTPTINSVFTGQTDAQTSSRTQSDVITEARSEVESSPLAEPQSTVKSTSSNLSIPLTEVKALSTTKAETRSTVTPTQTTRSTFRPTVTIDPGENRGKEQSFFDEITPEQENERAPSVDAILTGSTTQQTDQDEIFSGFEERKLSKDFQFNLF